MPTAEPMQAMMKAVAFADVGVVTHNVVSFHALRHKLV